MSDYIVTEIDLTPGERISVVKDAASGLPLFDAVVWATSELRSAGHRPNTIAQAMRSVAVMQRYFDLHNVNLDARLREGKFLIQSEATGLAAHCRLGLRRASNAEVTAARSSLGQKVADLHARRTATPEGQPSPTATVKDSTASVRAHFIKKFLTWKLDDYLFKVGVDDQRYRDLQALGKKAIEAFAEKSPRSRDFRELDARQGLTGESRDLLEYITEPSSSRNPWKDLHTRSRNHLIVQLFLALGPRAGELLGLRVRDFSAANGTIVILRRPDNAEDTRARRGEVKTRERELKLNPTLSELTRSYILNERRAIRGARKHEFLFVASKSGRPLSYSALAKSFAQLRHAYPEALEGVVAHMLRHTWNDSFSEQADESGLAPQREQKIRSYLMGWSEHSGMASRYTRRHTQREADEHMEAIQKKAMERKAK